MSGRPAAQPTEIRIGRFGWAAEVPWLPDLLSAPRTVTGNVVGEAFGRQIGFLRGLAAGAPPGSAVQLRYSAGGDADRVSCSLVAAADSLAQAEILSRVVASALPPELPLTAVVPQAVDSVLRAVDPDRLDGESVAEIRRSVDQLDPTLDGSIPADKVVFPWTWSTQSLLTSLGLLRQQECLTTLVVHVEPAELDPLVALFMQDEIGRLIGELRDGEEQPLTQTAIRAYGRWLRLLPRAALHVRVLLASAGRLAPGLAASVSTDLTATFEGSAVTATGVADIVAPQTGAAVDACATLLDEVRSELIHPPDHSELAALLHLFDPVEAHSAFRFPVAPRGGLPGIGTRRPDGINAGMPTRTEAVAIELGATTMGGRFGLSRGDLNQHILVAGLPGFGKSSTVKLLLQRAYLALGIPFLVIDPAKGDYEELFGGLDAQDAGGVVHRLQPRHVAFNPLAVPDGVEPAIHGGRVAAVFESALNFGQWAAGPMFLRRAIARLYDEASGTGHQPALIDLYRQCGELIVRSGISGSNRTDLRASLLGRIEMLGAGTAGRALLGGPTDGIDWAELMTRPTLIELGGFSGPTERSLLFGLLMAGLVSWREAHPAPALAHLTVLEEAHRVLRRADHSSDVGVELFVDAIAELRGAGEGFVVVDQTPTALHPAVLKITGTKLVHRLVEQEERNTVGSAMVLDKQGAEDLARLGRQRVIAYAASSDAAELIDVDNWRESGDGRDFVPGVPALSVRFSLALAPSPAPIFCVDCPVMCKGRSGLRNVAEVLAKAGPEPMEETLVSVLWTATLPTIVDEPNTALQGARLYCTVAAALAKSSQAEPWRLPRQLEKLQRFYRIRSSQIAREESHDRVTTD